MQHKQNAMKMRIVARIKRYENDDYSTNKTLLKNVILQRSKNAIKKSVPIIAPPNIAFVKAL